MIDSGSIEGIQWSNGPWLIFDIGFSNKRRTCGLLLHDGKPKSYGYARYNGAQLNVEDLLE